jgi:DNA-binding response OmpR family regulator
LCTVAFFAIINRLFKQKNLNQQTPAAATDQTVATPENTNMKRVLIIEDEQPLAHALELKLSHSGYDAKAVNNGEDALETLSKAKYDLILLDLILPGMDGFELLQNIRDKHTDTKIVILSNLGQPEDKARAETYDITNYYIKSNTPLAAVVQSVQSLI